MATNTPSSSKQPWTPPSLTATKSGSLSAAKYPEARMMLCPISISKAKPVMQDLENTSRRSMMGCMLQVVEETGRDSGGRVSAGLYMTP